MPISNETVPNRPLSGDELRQVIMKDIDKSLIRDGMFSGHIAYGRVAYSIQIKLMVDNPLYPEHTNTVASEKAARNAPDDGSRVIEPAPLKGASPEAEIAAVQIDRTIDSPNHTRLEAGLPVTVTRRDPSNGHMTDVPVQYDNTGLEPGKHKETDITEQTKAEWKMD